MGLKPRECSGMELAEGGYELRFELEMIIDLVENELLGFVIGLECILQFGGQLFLQFLLDGCNAIDTTLLVRQSLKKSDRARHVFQNRCGHLE